jgi:hypothetical protein
LAGQFRATGSALATAGIVKAIEAKIIRIGRSGQAQGQTAT